MFNDVAEHDITWGEYSINFNADIDHSAIQHLLTLGLGRVLEIISCGSYADRERLLRVDEMPPGENDAFLRCALDNAQVLDPLEGVG